MENYISAPEGYHYRGMAASSPNSKLCCFISEEKAFLNGKIDTFICGHMIQLKILQIPMEK
jgi:hypothetical protein